MMSTISLWPVSLFILLTIACCSLQACESDSADICLHRSELAAHPDCLSQCAAVTLRMTVNLLDVMNAENEDTVPTGADKRASFIRMGKKKRASFIRMGKKKRASFVRMGKKKRASFVRMGKKKRASFVRMGKKKRASFVRMGKQFSTEQDDKKRASFMRLG